VRGRPRNFEGATGRRWRAITWIRRAAQVAGQAGDDERALALALAATDLAERFVSSDVMPVARKHDESAETSEVDVGEFRKTS
jgi:hypothetical protein